MTEVSDEQFQQMVEDAVAAIPERFARHLNNVAFMVVEEPTPAQLGVHGGLHGRGVLLGLYEGIPLPVRNDGYNGVMPDVISIFKKSHELVAGSVAEMHKQVHQTVWHEVAHYFGLDHGQIKALES
jgi:predicted Zn-dependent protease with MMP-like domain